MNRTKTVLVKTAIFGFFPGIVGVSLLPANMLWLFSFVSMMVGMTAFAVFMAMVVFGQIKKSRTEPLTDDDLEALLAENNEADLSTTKSNSVNESRYLQHLDLAQGRTDAQIETLQAVTACYETEYAAEEAFNTDPAVIALRAQIQSLPSAIELMRVRALNKKLRALHSMQEAEDELAVIDTKAEAETAEAKNA